MGRHMGWDREPYGDRRATNAVWAGVFFGLAIMLLVNRTPQNAAWIVIAGAVAGIVGCVFTWRFIMENDDD